VLHQLELLLHQVEELLLLVLRGGRESSRCCCRSSICMGALQGATSCPCCMAGTCSWQLLGHRRIHEPAACLTCVLCPVTAVPMAVPIAAMQVVPCSKVTRSSSSCCR
jgi:hypothetical protein